MVTSEDVDVVRHIVQKIVVPCVVVIGLLGNTVSIIVLTRKRMRCSTNVYLTALAITDIIYLTMVLILSLQHYDYVHLHYEIYWKCYSFVIWLTDGCAYISIYIAVSFTIERFIAIRYPIKRQTFCTELLAKKVIAGVVIFCLLSTISTAFEHVSVTTQQLRNNFGVECKSTAIGQSILNIPNEFNQTKQFDGIAETPKFLNFNGTINNTNLQNDCHNVTYFKTTYSALGHNDTYKQIFFFLTSIIFVFIPLSILAAFNICLIILVRRSKKTRGEMTHASSMRRVKNKHSSVSQENKITVTLIAVVILFIVCQLPWAICLIVTELITIERNLENIIGNIFNLLAAINAAANFFLYCVLSDKYRKTVRELITGYKYRRRNMSVSTSSHISSTRRCTQRLVK